MEEQQAHQVETVADLLNIGARLSVNNRRGSDDDGDAVMEDQQHHQTHHVMVHDFYSRCHSRTRRMNDKFSELRRLKGWVPNHTPLPEGSCRVPDREGSAAYPTPFLTVFRVSRDLWTTGELEVGGKDNSVDGHRLCVKLFTGHPALQIPEVTSMIMTFLLENPLDGHNFACALTLMERVYVLLRKDADPLSWVRKPVDKGYLPVTRYVKVPTLNTMLLPLIPVCEQGVNTPFEYDRWADSHLPEQIPFETCWVWYTGLIGREAKDATPTWWLESIARQQWTVPELATHSGKSKSSARYLSYPHHRSSAKLMQQSRNTQPRSICALWMTKSDSVGTNRCTDYEGMWYHLYWRRLCTILERKASEGGPMSRFWPNIHCGWQELVRQLEGDGTVEAWKRLQRFLSRMSMPGLLHRCVDCLRPLELTSTTSPNNRFEYDELEILSLRADYDGAHPLLEWSPIARGLGPALERVVGLGWGRWNAVQGAVNAIEKESDHACMKQRERDRNASDDWGVERLKDPSLESAQVLRLRDEIIEQRIQEGFPLLGYRGDHYGCHELTVGPHSDFRYESCATTELSSVTKLADGSFASSRRSTSDNKGKSLLDVKDTEIRTPVDPTMGVTDNQERLNHVYAKAPTRCFGCLARWRPMITLAEAWGRIVLAHEGVPSRDLPCFGSLGLSQRMGLNPMQSGLLYKLDANFDLEDFSLEHPQANAVLPDLQYKRDGSLTDRLAPRQVGTNANNAAQLYEHSRLPFGTDLSENAWVMRATMLLLGTPKREGPSCLGVDGASWRQRFRSVHGEEELYRYAFTSSETLKELLGAPYQKAPDYFESGHEWISDHVRTCDPTRAAYFLRLTTLLPGRSFWVNPCALAEGSRVIRPFSAAEDPDSEDDDRDTDEKEAGAMRWSMQTGNWDAQGFLGLDGSRLFSRVLVGMHNAYTSTPWKGVLDLSQSGQMGCFMGLTTDSSLFEGQYRRIGEGGLHRGIGSPNLGPGMASYNDWSFMRLARRTYVYAEDVDWLIRLALDTYGGHSVRGGKLDRLYPQQTEWEHNRTFVHTALTHFFGPVEFPTGRRMNEGTCYVRQVRPNGHSTTNFYTPIDNILDGYELPGSFPKKGNHYLLSELVGERYNTWRGCMGEPNFFGELPDLPDALRWWPEEWVLDPKLARQSLWLKNNTNLFEYVGHTIRDEGPSHFHKVHPTPFLGMRLLPPHRVREMAHEVDDRRGEAVRLVREAERRRKDDQRHAEKELEAAVRGKRKSATSSCGETAPPPLRLHLVPAPVAKWLIPLFEQLYPCDPSMTRTKWISRQGKCSVLIEAIHLLSRAEDHDLRDQNADLVESITRMERWTECWDLLRTAIRVAPHDFPLALRTRLRLRAHDDPPTLEWVARKARRLIQKAEVDALARAHRPTKKARKGPSPLGTRRTAAASPKTAAEKGRPVDDRNE